MEYKIRRLEHVNALFAVKKVRKVEVSRLLGISHSRLSQILNGYIKVVPPTFEKRVIDAIHQIADERGQK